MGTQKTKNLLVRIWLGVIRSMRRLDEWTHGWLGMVADAGRQALMPGSAINAAAIAYFSIFSLFPITLLSITIASLNPVSLMDYHAIVNRLEFFAPALGLLLGKNFDDIIQARGPITLVAFIGLIWSASTIFFTFNQTLHKIWSDKRRRSVWKRRGLSILFVLIFVGPILFLASIASSLFTNLMSWVPENLIQIVSVTGIMISILLNISLFMVIYMVLPHGGSTWHEILPGAIGAGLLWELAKKAFLAFVTTYLSISNLVYGSVTAIIAFLLWVYISGLIFIFGASLSVIYFQRTQKAKETALPPDK
ncbi:MAG TPA: YihY/virulence factor BrkB family protein [Anaerolineales bacterium]|nr:YihY/virulence factor BrkB family protein [Anaerolineales bacterium]